jgi:hypothetical protein
MSFLDYLCKENKLQELSTKKSRNPDLAKNIQPEINKVRQELNQLKEEEFLANGYQKVGGKWVKI